MSVAAVGDQVVSANVLARQRSRAKEVAMRFLLFPALVLLAAAGDASSIQIDHPWARATAGMSTTGAAYLTITDNGPPDELTGASTPVAATADLHETTSDSGGSSMNGMNMGGMNMSGMGGAMKMRPVASIALPTGKPVTLTPGGYHVMMTGLKAPLKQGDTFPLTLRFAHAPPQTVSVQVQAVGATSAR
jgi:periplasmic copper chaperone A